MPGPTRNVGAKVVLDGEKEYKQALQDLNTGNKTLASEMKKLQAEFKGNTESTEYLTKAGELLERQLLQQQDKVAKLREAVAYSAKEYGEASATTQKYIQQLNNAEAAEFELKHAIEENTEALNGENEEMLGLGDTVEALADKLGIRLPQGATDALNGMEGLSAGTVAAMAAAAAAIAAVIKVVSDLGKLTLEVAAQVDEYLTQSSITGVPTEMLQAWDYAAPLIDTDAETIMNAMTKITQAMGDAASGSESAQEKFAALGVNIQDEVTGGLRSAEEVFYEVVDALGEMGAGTERDAAAMDLMGKSAQELNPLINAGSAALREYGEEAMNAGYILDEQQIQKLGEVDDAYQKLQLTIEANRKQLAADFAPAAKAAMELFSDVVKKAGEMLERSGLIENLATLLVTITDIASGLIDLIDGIPSWLNPIQQLSNAFKALAVVVATVADAAQAINGLAPWNWGSGQFSTAMGWNRNKGELSHTQTVLYGDAGGFVLDPNTGKYVGNYGYSNGFNAGGTENWRGGLTWVGEAGPELVNLPRGTQILNAQDSESRMGSVYIGSVVIDAKNVQEFNDIVRMAQTAAVEQMMG
ncbi:MAG: hypothetical protein II008_13130 [Oscillospiraceae bacterium]|nr:hypothetical protein [Oscillospiraceae bacterium]